MSPGDHYYRSPPYHTVASKDMEKKDLPGNKHIAPMEEESPSSQLPLKGIFDRSPGEKITLAKNNGQKPWPHFHQNITSGNGGSKNTYFLPESNMISPPENGWLENDVFPSGIRPIFKRELLVLGRVPLKTWLPCLSFLAGLASLTVGWTLKSHLGTEGLTWQSISILVNIKWWNITTLFWICKG